jgi:hypothetical protein
MKSVRTVKAEIEDVKRDLEFDAAALRERWRSIVRRIAIACAVLIGISLLVRLLRAVNST